MDWIHFVTLIEIPAFGVLFWMIIRSQKDFEGLSKEFYNYKTEVAEKYSTAEKLEGVEKRLVEHLIRIEDRLEKRTA